MPHFKKVKKNVAGSRARSKKVLSGRHKRDLNRMQAETNTSVVKTRKLTAPKKQHAISKKKSPSGPTPEQLRQVESLMAWQVQSASSCFVVGQPRNAG